MRWLFLLLAVLLVAAPIVSHDRWPDTDGPRSSVVSVSSYGASCNGSADDTVEIQTALDSVALPIATDTGAGGIVSLPNGICMISDTVNVPNGVTLSGLGPSVSVLRATAAFPLTSTPMVTLASEAGEACKKTSIRNLALDANTRAELALSSDCLSHQSRVSLLRVLNLVEDGILVSNTNSPGDFSMESISVEYATAPTATSIGLALQGKPRELADVTIVGFTGANAGSQGIRIDDPAAAMVDPVVTNVRISDIGNGLILDDTRDGFVANIYCESTVPDCVQIETSNAGINIMNLYHDHNDGADDTIVDVVSSISYTDKHITEYSVGFGASVGDRNLIVRSSGSRNIAKPWTSGTTSPTTCVVAVLGALFYDTDAGTAASGAADQGKLCICHDNVVNGYNWFPLEYSVPGDLGIPVLLTGGSATNCGT